ncbi:hypothetical protein [Plantactinospora mayteni]|uniref:hypothetical protein n=1 Tax=Plantactinospora mayteni TaxID=566021 RepID=UPI001944CE7B|nr:hypothetical protein [Plantactinospora mayteni]
MSDRRDALLAYGLAFDEAVDIAADTLARIGYPSRHASKVQCAEDGAENDLRQAIGQLGLLCLRVESEFATPFVLDDAKPSSYWSGFLAVHAASRRVVHVTRAAQLAGELDGRAEAELDGDLDELEESLVYLNDPARLSTAAGEFMATAHQFDDLLPMSIKLELDGLRSALIRNDQ